MIVYFIMCDYYYDLYQTKTINEIVSIIKLVNKMIRVLLANLKNRLLNYLCQISLNLLYRTLNLVVNLYLLVTNRPCASNR